jgi:hypothetical protein
MQTKAQRATFGGTGFSVATAGNCSPELIVSWGISSPELVTPQKIGRIGIKKCPESTT